MIQKIIAFRDNILLFSLGCYGIGFIYMVLYYSAFNIPVIYYLSLNDLLLFALTIILPVAVIALILEIIVMSELKIIINQLLRRFKRSEINDQNLDTILSTLIFILMLLYLIVVKTKISPNVHFFIILSAVVFLGRIFSNNNSNRLKSSVFLFCLGFLVGIFSIINFGKTGKANLEVKFRYNDKIVNTTYWTDVIYIGETSSSIFLYDVATQATSVFEKEKISNLVYLDYIANRGWYNRTISFPQYPRIIINPRNDTISKNYIWNNSKDEFLYVVNANQTPAGISSTVLMLNGLLKKNKFDPEIPYEDYSYLPSDLKITEDYKKMNDALMSGNYEINRWWANSSGMINLQMNKKHYSIQVIYKDTINKKVIK